MKFILNFGIQSLSISNFFLNIYILFILMFFGYLDIASEGFVVISLINVFTHGLSGNIRNIYLGTKQTMSLKKIISFRLIVGLFGILIAPFIIYLFIGKNNITFHILLMILTVSNWIFELLIARNEKNRLLNIFHGLNISLFVLSFPLLLYLGLIKYVVIFFFFYIFFNYFIYRKFFLNIFKFTIFSRQDILLNLNIGTLSTFLKTLSNFILRYSLLILVGKTQSSILFMGFSLGSVYGTLFDISYGASFIKNIKNLKNYFMNLFFIIYVIIVFSFIFYYGKYSYLSIDQFNLLFNTTLFSTLGAYISVIGLESRQKFYENALLQNLCYKVDILIYSFNSLVAIILYQINESYLILVYLVCSVFLFLIYKLLMSNALKKSF